MKWGVSLGALAAGEQQSEELELLSSAHEDGDSHVVESFSCQVTFSR